MPKNKPKWVGLPVPYSFEREGVTTAYRRNDGNFLIRRANGRFVQWEILDRDSRLVMAQLELPGMPDQGAPFSWANEMLDS